MQIAQTGIATANAQHAGDGLGAADRADGGRIGVGDVAFLELMRTVGEHHLQRRHHDGGGSKVTVFGEQAHQHATAQRVTFFCAHLAQ